MSKLQFKNKWILVTGASSGLGEEMARQLAFQHQANLILLARRKEKLEELKAELEKEAKVSVKVISADLANLEDVDRAIDEVLKNGQLYGAILNAGVTYFGRHSELPWDEFQNMLQINVISVVRITNRLVDFFETTGNEGGILLVSSMAAILPVPYQSAYSGTKAFILTFASTLAHEIKNPRFSLTVYTPGGIATEMTAGEKFSDLRSWLVPVGEAARDGIYAFRNRKSLYIPGFLNKMGSVLMNLLPKKIITRKMSGIYYKALLKSEALNIKP